MTDTAPRPDARPSQMALLRSRRFLPLFVVQFLGAFNDQAFKTAFVALLTWRLAREQGLEDQVDLMVQLAGAFFILPFALVSPTAGLLSDRIDKARMMVWVKGAEIVLMALAALAFHLQNVWVLFGLVLLMGAQSAFFAPIKYAVLPSYLKREELVAGNGLVQAATFMAIILGQIAGAKLVLTGAGVLIVSVLVIAVAVAGWLAALRALPVPPVPGAPRIDWVLPRAMVATVRGCARSPEPFFAILCFGWFWMPAAVVLNFIPPIAKDDLHGTADVALILLVMFSIGIACGALVCNTVLRGRIGYGAVPVGALGIVAGLLLFRFALPQFGADIPPGAPLLDAGAFLARLDAWPVLGAFLTMSLFAGLYVVPLSVIYQATAPAAERGRFVACSNVVDASAMVLASALAIGLGAAGLAREDIVALFALSGLPVAAIVWRHHLRHPRLFT